MLTTSAPGKTILLGEYAVLWGGPALVVAVDRRATCTFEPGPETIVCAPGLGEYRPHGINTGRPLQFVEALYQDLEVPTGRYTIDSAALYAEANGRRQKLGLGSSAATSVAFAGAIWSAQGHEIDAAAQHAIFAQVMSAHQRVQGGGSGADVAASTFGGALRYAWFEEGPDDTPQAHDKIAVDGKGTALFDRVGGAQRHILAVWTGTPADTPTFIEQVSDLRSAHPTRWRQCMDELAAAAEAGIGAWEANDLATLALAAQSTGATLEALGQAAGASIVTDTHRALMSLVAPEDAVVKPTGAGGGDLGWVIARRVEDEVRTLTRLQRAGYAAWRLPIAMAGIRVDPAPTSRESLS